MKIALCLFGAVGQPQASSLRTNNNNVKMETRGEKSKYFHPALTAKYYKSSITDHFNTDVFIHSWSTMFKDEILECYSPISHIIEEQIEFPVDLEKYGIHGKNIDKWKCSEHAKAAYAHLVPSRNGVENVIDELENRLGYRSQSRWYSSKISNDLKLKHEQENNFKYDFVFSGRLDLALKFQVPFSQMDKNCIYAPDRKDKTKISEAWGLNDFYFTGGSEVIDKFSTLYDHRHDYCLRNPFACREHIEKVIGAENIRSFGDRLFHHFYLARHL